jgi:hypothetical protein
VRSASAAGRRSFASAPTRSSETRSGLSVGAWRVYDRYMLRWRRLALPAFLGVLGLIWVAAHALAHDVAMQPSGSHGAGHGRGLDSYLAYLPTSLALCLTLATAIATGAALGKRWAGRSGRSIWLFGFVPVLGFAADTLVELSAHGATATALFELVPVFLIGLLVQIPFALVAVGLAGRILWLAERLAWPLPEGSRLSRPAEATSLAWADTAEARAFLFPSATRSRGPPLGLHS